MKRRQALPWLQATEASVRAEPWMVSLEGGDYVPLSDFLGNWDYQSKLTLRRKMIIDPERLHAEIDAVSGIWAFSVLVEVGTGQGTLPRRVVQSHLFTVPSAKDPMHFELTLSSQELSAQLVLNTSLLVKIAGTGRSELAPAHPGARLWSDRSVCRLEGEEQRFPMEAVSFQRLFPGRPQEHALWYVHWDPHQIDRDFHGAIRLYINSDNDEFLESVTREDSTVLQLLLGNVMAQIVSSVVSDPLCDEMLQECDAGTLGSQISNWVRLAFGDVGIEQVRSTLELRPGDFHAAMQAAAQF